MFRGSYSRICLHQYLPSLASLLTGWRRDPLGANGSTVPNITQVLCWWSHPCTVTYAFMQVLSVVGGGVMLIYSRSSFRRTRLSCPTHISLAHWPCVSQWNSWKEPCEIHAQAGGPATAPSPTMERMHSGRTAPLAWRPEWMPRAELQLTPVIV